MNDAHRNACWLAATSAATALAFAGLTVAVTRGHVRRWDREAKRRIKSWTAEQRGARETAQAAAPIGKWGSQVAGSLVTAARMLASGRRAAALAIAGASLGGVLLTPLLERVTPRRRPPLEHPDRGDPTKQSYPSGHAVRSSATAVTTGYVLWREGSARWTAAGITLGSLATSGGKLVLSRHWTTDVLGGYLAGVALGTACACLYEVGRGSGKA